MLVEADYISAWISKARGNLRRVRSDGLDDFAATGNDGVKRRRHAVHIDIEEQADGCAGRAPEHPSAAHFADRVVKGGAAVTALADVPTEDFAIELRRARNVRGRHFEIANLAIRHCGRYESSFKKGNSAREVYRTDCLGIPVVQHQGRRLSRHAKLAEDNTRQNRAAQHGDGEAEKRAD